MSERVKRWLTELGFGEYADAFAEQKVAYADLIELNDADLKELGIPLGPRKRLLKAIANLRAEQTIETLATVESGAQAPPIAETHEAERRQLTVMFCDLVSSTELSQKLDPEDMREVNRAYQDACKTTIERYEGYVARYMGDGVLAYFGYPEAHEDDAERAVHAGLNLVDAVSALSGCCGRMNEVNLAVRVGIATGPVVVGDLIGEGASQESAVVGETPNLAARLQGLAAANTVIIASATHDLARGRFVYEEIGPQRLKGIAKLVRAWRVIAPSAAESRFEALHDAGLTPLIGREHEIGLLLERWEQAKEREGQAVLLSGAPGIGKSRIVQALRERTASEHPTRLLYQCSPYYTNSALHPVIEQLERVMHLVTEDSPTVKLEKLEALLAQSTQDIAAVAPLLAALMSIPAEGRYAPLEMAPEREKEKMLGALVEQIEGLSRHRPALVIFEDVHWADPTTLELLGLVVEEAQRMRVLVLITFRPEFLPPWTGDTHITSLTLNRFGRRQAIALVDKMTGKKRLPDEVRDEIIEKTDGVPLFVEELTKTVIESDLLEDREDHYTLTRPLVSLAIPSTLRDSLMARLDRLAPVKEVAQLAAVIGREFTHDVLAAVSTLTEDKLRDALDQLMEAGLIFHRGTRPNVSYRYKHALVQDAAYESLLKSKRRQLHARIASILEEKFPEITKTQPELLAYHYSAADLAENAVGYYLNAGKRAAERSANIEAIAHFTHGLEAVATLPESRDRSAKEFSLTVALGPPQIHTKGYGSPDVERTYRRAWKLGRELGETQQTYLVLCGLWVTHSVQGKLRQCWEFAEQLLALAESSQDPGVLLEAHCAFGNTRMWLGQMVLALEHFDHGLALYDRDRHSSHASLWGVDPEQTCLIFGAWCLWLLGYPDKAVARIEKAIALVSNEARPIKAVRAFNWTAMLHQFRRDTPVVETWAQKAIRLSKEYAFPHWLAQARILEGRVLFDQGQRESGIAQMRDSLTAYLDTGAGVRKPFYLALLAETYSKTGRAKKGLDVLEEALASVEQTEERWWESDLYRLKAELLRDSGSMDGDVETCLRQAVDIARNQSAKSLELRAATNLAHLWQDQGKRDDARELLASVYNWFTEGFDTADLKDAKALLDELT